MDPLRGAGPGAQPARAALDRTRRRSLRRRRLRRRGARPDGRAGRLAGARRAVVRGQAGAERAARLPVPARHPGVRGRPPPRRAGVGRPPRTLPPPVGLAGRLRRTSCGHRPGPGTLGRPAAGRHRRRGRPSAARRAGRRHAVARRLAPGRRRGAPCGGRRPGLRRSADRAQAGPGPGPGPSAGRTTVGGKQPARSGSRFSGHPPRRRPHPGQPGGQWHRRYRVGGHRGGPGPRRPGVRAGRRPGLPARRARAGPRAWPSRGPICA